LPWLAPQRAPGRTVRDLGADLAAPGALRSDTGELMRDPQAGVFTLDTRRSQGAAGELAGREIALSRTRIAAADAGGVSFTSLDGEPLERSRSVLVSRAARACALDGKARAFRSEPLRGSAWLAGNTARVLVPLGAGGERGTPVALTREGKGERIPLDFDAHWALIEPARQTRPR
jgi:hypothetical protein